VDTIVQKVVSGGQTGADRAALDFAITHEIPHGGWCPAGRKAEDGIIPARYQLKETPSSSYLQRTEWNIRDSDGTVVFSIAAELTGGSKKTVFLAHKIGKPLLRISRDGGVASSPDQELARFIRDGRIKVLNVAGPRASKVPEIDGFVKEVLTKALAKAPEPAPTCVLVSERDQQFIDFIKPILGHVAHGEVKVITPPSERELDLLKLSSREKWDFAILFANNVLYESGSRSPEGLERGAAGLVRTLVQDFKRPVLVLYAYPDLETFPIRLCEAGASAVLRVPPELSELKEAIRRCLPVRQGIDLADQPPP
jgi:hypothetical protein